MNNRLQPYHGDFIFFSFDMRTLHKFKSEWSIPDDLPLSLK